MADERAADEGSRAEDGPRADPAAGTASTSEAETRPLDARADAEASRIAPWWDAGGPAFTLAFWASVGLMVVALFRTTLLPLVDYPQHLALAAILRRMMSPGAPERALFETNLASFNSAFHAIVALLNVVLPIDAAGKVVVGGYVVLSAIATLLLLRATGRPRARAFLMLPAIVGYSFAWGFINFELALAIQLIVVARVLEVRARRGRGRVVHELITMALAVLGAWTHLFGSALGYLLILVAIVVRAQTAREPLARRLGRALRTGAPLLPAIGYCLFVYLGRKKLPFQSFDFEAYDGNDIFAYQKLKGFLGYVGGLRADELDVRIVGLVCGLLLLSALFRDPNDEAHPALPWLFVASLLTFLALPHVLGATYVFERVAYLVVLTAVLWAPRATRRAEEILRPLYALVGLGAAAAFFSLMGRVGDETADLDAVLREMPKGRRVTGLVWYPKLDSTMQWSMLHAPAYYVARNGGEVAFSFTRTMSLPVHYKRETLPPELPPDFEWNPQDYRTDAAWARYFDLVLLKTMYDDGIDPRASLWGARAGEVNVVLHHGRWWVFETKHVSELPTPPSAEGPGD